MPVKRGDIYWVDFEPGKGSEQGGRQPALVVQNDLGNSFSPTTVVVAVTRTIPPRPYPFAVIIEPADSGLPDRSTINCSQVATVQQSGPASRLLAPLGESQVRPIGRLGAEKMAEVDQALRYSLDLL
ncbi:MAG TPA: type II toxin-antitoxin system PemK/MazF family toxin [Chloroflexota bacterium]|nr:type II toxin-antitoxin system PemK/MazF family toxin [Chloroflexota bacterium]